MNQDPTNPLDQEIRDLITQGQTIPAIKLYRERTGCGLAEAKHAVEERLKNSTSGKAAVNHSDLNSILLDHISRGEKIAAVRYYREQTRCGLRDAKDYVEALMEKTGVPIQSGNMGGLLFIAAGVIILALLVGAFVFFG